MCLENPMCLRLNETGETELNETEQTEKTATKVATKAVTRLTLAPKLTLLGFSWLSLLLS